MQREEGGTGDRNLLRGGRKLIIVMFLVDVPRCSPNFLSFFYFLFVLPACYKQVKNTEDSYCCASVFICLNLFLSSLHAIGVVLE